MVFLSCSATLEKKREPENPFWGRTEPLDIFSPIGVLLLLLFAHEQTGHVRREGRLLAFRLAPAGRWDLVKWLEAGGMEL